MQEQNNCYMIVYNTHVLYGKNIMLMPNMSSTYQ